MAKLSEFGGDMQPAQAAHQHKTIFQQQRVQQHLERTLEEQRLHKLKASLQAKLESSFPKKVQST